MCRRGHTESLFDPKLTDNFSIAIKHFLSNKNCSLSLSNDCGDTLADLLAWLLTNPILLSRDFAHYFVMVMYPPLLADRLLS